MEKIALVSITKHGVSMIRSLQPLMPNADLYYMTKFAQGDEAELRITTFEGSVRKIIPQLFEEYDGVTFVVSLGAVVRMIAPILKDKKTDPAVVVIDDKGEFVISVLSGHLGGANELTRTIAKLLEATPVITTASDVQKTIAVDLLGRDLGWVIEDDQYVTPVSAAVVNEESVIVVQESGEQNWWKYSHELPANIKLLNSLEEVRSAEFNAALVITHRIIPEDISAKLLTKSVIYRPKSVHLGMGCNRGTSAEEIEWVISETLRELEISTLSVKGISSIDLKKDEQGFIDVCEKYNWDFTYYTPEQLNEITIENPSETVYKYTGAYGVSEPAAKRSASTDWLLLEKKKLGNVTISVAVEGLSTKKQQYSTKKC